MRNLLWHHPQASRIDSQPRRESIPGTRGRDRPFTLRQSSQTASFLLVFFTSSEETEAAMPNAQSVHIHPTALISHEAELASDVVVGPFVVIEGRVRIGPGCVLRPYVHLSGPLTM